MTNIVLFGPPGAGKGTQAQKLVEKYGFNHISTGEVIRDEIRRGTDLGKQAVSFTERGELAPDILVINMITDYMQAHKDNAGNIFDGFPRTRAQAVEFDAILAGHGLQVDVMLSLDVPDPVLTERILLRGIDSGRADDTDIRIISNRIRVYKEQTAVVGDYYAGQDKYISVNGTGSIEEVFGRLCEAIDRIKKG